MGWTTIVGLLLGFGALIVSNSLDGGTLQGLMNLPGMVIVLGGTIGTAFTSFPPKAMLSLPKIIVKVFTQKVPDPRGTINFLIEMADKARRQGLLSLEEECSRIDDLFILKGIQMVVDGTTPDTIRELLESESDSISERHASKYAVLEKMGGYAPTMGIIGTVMGLVSVLGKLGGDPSSLGGSIATAFIATLYGVSTANLLWLPLGEKLKQADQSEALMRRIIIEGILALQAGDNPRIVRMKLEAFLPPAERSAEEKGAEAPARATA